MLVKYLGNNNSLLKHGKEYNIDYVCGNKGGYVIVEDSQRVLYDSVVDLALDWDILGDKFITREEYKETMKMFTVLP